MVSRTPIPVRVAASLLLALAVPGCGEDDDAGGGSPSAWGPLAVVPGLPSGDEALISGTLVITDDCVTIRSGSDREQSLLVWSADATSWNAETRTIQYRDGEETVELSDQDRAAFGGGGSSIHEDGVPPADWMDSIEWVSQPDASCPMDLRWFVGDLSDHTPADPGHKPTALCDLGCGRNSYERLSKVHLPTAPKPLTPLGPSVSHARMASGWTTKGGSMSSNCKPYFGL